MIDQNCISYWFPKLLEVIPNSVPATHLVQAPNCLIDLLDGHTPEEFEPFLDELKVYGATVGYPCFLRTGHTSDKHSWDNTCCVRKPEDFGQHVCRLVEFSECAGIFGLPYDIWAVRAWLSGPVIGYAPAYGNMPMRREFRIFIRGGKIQCCHPYWPTDSLLQGGCDETTMAGVDEMNHLGESEIVVRDLALMVAIAFPEYWSVDCLWTDRGWFVTDMAKGDNSWHWPACPFAEGL